MYLLIVVTIIILYLIHRYKQYQSAMNALRHLPWSPDADLMHLHYVDKFDATRAKVEKFKPDPLSIIFGSRLRVVRVLDPELSKIVLQEFNRGVFDFARKFLGENIFNTDDYEYWKNDKKALSHAFAPRTLAVELYPHLDSIVNNAHKHLSSLQSNLIEVDGLAQQITFDVIGKMVYGKDYNTVGGNKESSEFLENVSEGFRLGGIVVADPLALFRNPFFAYKFISTWRKISALSSSIIKERIKSISENSNNSNYKKKEDILQYVLDARVGKAITKKVMREIYEDIAIFLTAGFETTAHTVAFSMYFVAKHPEVQEKAFQEISQLDSFKKGLLFPEHAELSKLQYLNTIIQEALRIYPIAGQMAREITKDIKVGDAFIPGGTIAMVSLIGITHNPDQFPEPEKFKPERWINDPHPPGYYPFGYGQRACLGQNMAKVELLAVLSFLIGKYKWELKPGFVMKPVVEFTVKPKNGVWCNFYPRK